MLRVGGFHEAIRVCFMTTNKRNGAGWLLVMLSAVLVAICLWSYLRPDSEAAVQAAQVATRSGSHHGEAASPAPVVVSRFPVSAAGMVAVPRRFQLPGIGQVRSASSFQEWLAQYPSYQQAKISAFNRSHFGVYRVNSREQVAWMAANGYPMPEDVVAAEGLSDLDLFKLAGQGNDKAAFLLAERENDRLAAYLSKGGKRSDFYDGVEGVRGFEEELKIERLVERSNSPYKGYLQANKAISGLYADQGQDVIDVRVIAGLTWAGQLGDTRAGQFTREYVGGDPLRMLIDHTAAVVSNNASVDTEFMERSGGRRAGASGMPGSGSPVN